ncbi:MAG: hypothetical protein ACLUOI_36985 [Eisenbergiella sp.]
MRKSRKVLALLAMVAITAGALAGCVRTATNAGSSASTGGSSVAGTETAATAEKM